MHKLLVVLLLFLIIGMTIARRDRTKRKVGSHFNHETSSKQKRSSKFCSNNTIAQTYLSKILSLIRTFQSNTSYESILKLQSVHFFNYLTNRTNQELLHHDCQAFSKGLIDAIKLDQLIERTRKQLASIIRNGIKQVSQSVNNGKGFHEINY